MMSYLAIMPIATVLVVGFILKTALKAVIEREYDGWAPIVARVMVRFACRIHPSKADEWQDELANVKADCDTGLILGAHCVLGSLQSAASWFPARLRKLSWRRRPQAVQDTTIHGETAAVVVTAPAGAVIVSHAAQQAAIYHRMSHDRRNVIIQRNMEEARRNWAPPG
jgi:hypothetical protein